MLDPVAAIKEFLSGGPGIWLAPGEGKPPRDSVVVATSGSSGNRKLVVLSRAAVEAAAGAASARLGFSATWHLCLQPNYVAGLMVVARGQEGSGVRRATELSEVRLSQGANAISIVGTQLYRALDTPAQSLLAAMDVVLVGGAPLSTELRDRAQTVGIPVIETYGMSETCGGVVWDGRALPGIEISLDADSRIAVGGPTVFSGYYENEPLTSQVLVENRVLTSDRGSLVDGRLIIAGRIDDVVISGGVNVDLATVRAVVQRLEPETAVLAVPDPEWGVRIVLFGHGESLAGWRERLRALLPAPSLPRQFVALAELPRGAGGKPDTKKLLELVKS